MCVVSTRGKYEKKKHMGKGKTEREQIIPKMIRNKQQPIPSPLFPPHVLFFFFGFYRFPKGGFF